LLASADNETQMIVRGRVANTLDVKLLVHNHATGNACISARHVQYMYFDVAVESVAQCHEGDGWPAQ
jgi:hypothetical protein